HQHQQKDGLGCAEIRQIFIARRSRTCHVVILVIAQNSTPGGCAESDLTGNEYCVLGCGCVSDYAALIRPTELWLFVGLRLRLIRPTKLANVDLVAAERVGRISRRRNPTLPKQSAPWPDLRLAITYFHQTRHIHPQTGQSLLNWAIMPAFFFWPGAPVSTAL